MGAIDFITEPTLGTAVEDAFRNAVLEAAYEYGNGGHTGTIAEKSDWIVITDDPTDPAAAIIIAKQLLRDDDQRIQHSNDPAGAIRLTPDPDGRTRWLFFGIAKN